MHTMCPCYQQNSEQTIRQVLFVSGETGSVGISAHSIIYILYGSISISVAGMAEGVVMNRDEMAFLPIGTRSSFEAFESGSFMVFGLDKAIKNVPECHTFRRSRNVGHDPEREPAGLYKMEGNDRIREFVHMVLGTEQDGLKCISYAQLLVSQLIVLIQVYYPQDMYTRFYSTILSSDVEFSDFVHSNWRQYPVAAELSEAIKMTPQQFSARFRKVFGETPGMWIKRRRMRDIYHDICGSHKTLKEIAMDYDFSMPNFIRYCRPNFGRSPGAIREQLQMESDGSTSGYEQHRSA
jgi:AraC-like DNA-binding protein